MADTPTHDPRSSEQIRRDMARTRAEMDETIDALEERLSPGRIVDDLVTLVRRRGDGSGGGIGEVVKDHPIPLALMGLGLGWLAVEETRGRSDSRTDGNGRARPDVGTTARAEGRRGPYRGGAVDGDDDGPLDAVKDAASAAKETVKDAAGSAKDAVADAADRAGDAVSSAGDATSDAAGGARKKARQARHGIGAFIDENPLVAGAIAFSLGLASGAGAPSTDAEDRAMGHASDALEEEARRMARRTARDAKEVAERAADAAADELARREERADYETPAEALAQQAKDAAAGAAEAAKEAAREEAERRDLTAEGLKEDAREAAERTKEEATR